MIVEMAVALNDTSLLRMSNSIKITCEKVFRHATAMLRLLILLCVKSCDEEDISVRSGGPMPTSSRGAVVLAAMLFCAPVHANDAIAAVNNEISLAAGARLQSYHEFDAYRRVSGYLDSERGVQPMLQAAAVRQGAVLGVSDVFSAIALSVAAGHSNYDGYVLTSSSFGGIGAPLRQSNIGATIDVDLKFGKAFYLPNFPRIQITPYMIYEYHTWLRDSVETYSHHMLGIGLLIQQMVSKNVVLSADISVGRTLFGQVNSRHGVDERLGSRAVETLGVGMDYAISRHSHVTAAYQIKRFGYGQSSAVDGRYEGMQGTWYEPTSHSVEQAVLIGMAYHF